MYAMVFRMNTVHVTINLGLVAGIPVLENNLDVYAFMLTLDLDGFGENYIYVLI